jgi:phenylacetate-CoA ligase
MKKQSELIRLIRKRLSAELGISVDVKLVEKKTLERFDGKTARVIDKRKQ